MFVFLCVCVCVCVCGRAGEQSLFGIVQGGLDLALREVRDKERGRGER